MTVYVVVERPKRTDLTFIVAVYTDRKNAVARCKRERARDAGSTYRIAEYETADGKDD